MRICYIYIRVSTDEQATEGFSIENQKRACTEYALNNGYTIVRVFVDDGKSGRTTDRHAFQELLTLIKEELVDAVIIYKIDRFARNVGDFSSIRKQFKELGIKLLSVSENGDVTEGLIGNIFASVAEWESDVNGQRTRDALMQKFREGWQPTPPPLGYLSVGGERERKTCEPDQVVAPIIKELFEMYSTGDYSITSLQDWLDNQNIISKKGGVISRGGINNILSNPFYYGLIRWHGESKIGNHEPIITKELFDICQYILAKHRNFLVRKRIHDFLLRGFIFCDECEQRYTAEWHVKPISLKARGGKIAYYHCPKQNRNGCLAPYVEVGELEDQVKEEMRNVQFSEEFIQAVANKCCEYIENSRKTIVSERLGYQNQKTGLELKRSKLEDALLDGIIDREVFKRKHSEIQDKINALDQKITKVEKRTNIDIKFVDEVLSFTRNVYDTYADAPPFLKRHYLRFFYEKIYVEKRQISNVVYTPFIRTLAENNQVILRKAMLPLEDSNLGPIA